jgi:hypothetical protein
MEIVPGNRKQQKNVPDKCVKFGIYGRRSERSKLCSRMLSGTIVIKLVVCKYVEVFQTQLTNKTLSGILSRQKQRDFCQNVPDSSCLNRMCLGTWFPVPALCGGLIANLTSELLDECSLQRSHSK